MFWSNIRYYKNLLLNWTQSIVAPFYPRPFVISSLTFTLAIHLEFKNTDQKYKARIRSRVANLKDKKNPKLKEGVIMGLIPPERIANMSAEVWYIWGSLIIGCPNLFNKLHFKSQFLKMDRKYTGILSWVKICK